MERNLLVGNGINIQFGGVNVYSSSATMGRVVNNIKNGKYTVLTENSLSVDEQMEILKKLVIVIDMIRAGQYRNNADGQFMLKELERIKNTYPQKSEITSVFLEDYFLAFEIFNNGLKKIDGEEQSEKYRQIMFTLLRQMLVDGIYNDGVINELYKKFYPNIVPYLKGFKNIFTTNYDYNLENVLGGETEICHLHGEFGKLAPEYDIASKYYGANTAECNGLIEKQVSGMEHIYSNAIMSWSWLDKYGELMEPETKGKETLFKSIGGQLEILGLSPANDEHLFVMINNNRNINSVVYYYLRDLDRYELKKHIKKPVTFKKVEKFWNNMASSR